MSIQRYIAMKSSLFLPYDADQAPPKGCMVVVTYADHVAALAQAKRAHREALAEFMGGAYEQGQRDALAAIAEAEKEAYHRGYKSAASEFLTPAALEATGMDDPRYAKGYEQGQRDALAGAMDRVMGLFLGPWPEDGIDEAAVIAAIKGES